MAHSRKRKINMPNFFRKRKTHEFTNKLGNFEVDEYRDFYVIRKKLSVKGFYDPTTMVVAKKDKKVPIFPDRDYANVFGDYNAVMFFYTGIRGKDHFKDTMKRMVKGDEEFIGSPFFWKLRIGDTPKELLK